MEGMQQQQETNAALNSKRQRRPSVRLGEIGDVPLALFLENRPPLKRRKKRTVAVPTPAVSSIADDGDGRNGIVTMDAAEFEDDDPTAVDMTGFSLSDSGRHEAWPKTKPLEQVVSTATTTTDEVEAEFLADTVHASDQEDEPKLQECDDDDASKADNDAGINNLDQSDKNVVKNGRKGKRKQGGGAAAARNWRVRKAAAEEAARKAKTKKAAEACLSKDMSDEPTEPGIENGVALRNEDEEADKKEELDNKQESDPEKEANNQKHQQDPVQEELLLLTGEGKEDDPAQEIELRDSLDNEQAAAPATAPQIETTNVIKQHDQCDDSFVLPGSVKRWLEERKLGKYSDLFEYHEVDDEVLPLLTMEDLREMGIHAVGSRRKMLNAIQGLGNINNNKQGVD